MINRYPQLAEFLKRRVAGRVQPDDVLVPCLFPELVIAAFVDLFESRSTSASTGRSRNSLAQKECIVPMRDAIDL